MISSRSLVAKLSLWSTTQPTEYFPLLTTEKRLSQPTIVNEDNVRLSKWRLLTAVAVKRKHNAIFITWHPGAVSIRNLQNSLQWRHNGHNGVLNHQPHDCLLNRLFRRRSKKNQTSVSLAFVRAIHRRPVNSPHKWPVSRKMFPFDDVIL